MLGRRGQFEGVADWLLMQPLWTWQISMSLASVNTIIKNDLQLTCLTFHQTSIISGETNYLQTWKYDVRKQNDVTASNKHVTFTEMEYLILLKHSLKTLYKSKHLPGRYWRKRSEQEVAINCRSITWREERKPLELCGKQWNTIILLRFSIHFVSVDVNTDHVDNSRWTWWIPGWMQHCEVDIFT